MIVLYEFVCYVRPLSKLIKFPKTIAYLRVVVSYDGCVIEKSIILKIIQREHRYAKIMA